MSSSYSKGVLCDQIVKKADYAIRNWSRYGLTLNLTAIHQKKWCLHLGERHHDDILGDWQERF